MSHVMLLLRLLRWVMATHVNADTYITEYPIQLNNSTTLHAYKKLLALPAVQWPVSATIVINLDEKSPRMKNTTRALRHLDIPFIRVQAIRKHGLDRMVQNIPALKDPRLTFNLSAFMNMRHHESHLFNLGPQAVTLSHLLAVLTALDEIESGRVADGPVLVLEDDNIFDAKFKDVASKLIAHLTKVAPQWEQFGLGFNNVFKEGLLVDTMFSKVIGYTGAHCFLYRNRNTMLKILGLFNSKPGIIDVFWWDYSRKSYEVYVYNLNNMAIQDMCGLKSENSLSKSSLCGHKFMQIGHIEEPC